MAAHPNSSRLTSLSGPVSLAALLAGAHHAGAQIVTNTDLGRSGFTATGNFDWNVDADGANEFQLLVNPGPNTSLALYQLGSNGGGWVATAGNKIEALGPTDAISSLRDFVGQNPVTYISALFYGVGFSTGKSTYVGFRFVNDGDTFYGWAAMTFNFGGTSIVVDEWAYNSTVGEAIQVGDTGSAVPEPAAAATGLGLLALGAAGLRRKRYLKRNAA